MVSLDVDKMQAIDGMRGDLDGSGLGVSAKNISQDEIHHLVDEFMINTPAGVWGLKTARDRGRLETAGTWAAAVRPYIQACSEKRPGPVLCRKRGYGFGY